MKRILFCLLVLASQICLAQTSKQPVKQPVAVPKLSAHDLKVDSVLAEIDTLLMINNGYLEQLDIDLSLKDRFKLYQTDNIYNLLRLDTKTGQISQVQWSLNSDEECSVIINDTDLSYGMGYGSGTFELYPTKNMYQFILLDQTNGRMWHIQWGMKSAERWIRRIY